MHWTFQWNIYNHSSLYLAGDLGGNLGLFLGGSLLTVIELVDIIVMHFLYMAFCCCFCDCMSAKYKKWKRKRKQHKINKIKEEMIEAAKK